jgi:pseudaminic acid biosynthesis-associated methylase
METTQLKFWKGEFGQEYTDRNSYDQDSWDTFYLKNWGIVKSAMNEACMGFLDKNSKILEVGCNIGLQLMCFQRMGYENLHGIEIQHYAVEKAKQNTKGINIIQGSAFDLPYKDDWFDLVCTNGVLIHINPNDYDNIMSEMYRCTSKYIMGFEYYSEHLKEVNYRGNAGYLWKGDFAQEFIKRFPDLKLVYKQLYPYTTKTESGNVDYVYLLEKTK